MDRRDSKTSWKKRQNSNSKNQKQQKKKPRSNSKNQQLPKINNRMMMSDMI